MSFYEQHRTVLRSEKAKAVLLARKERSNQKIRKLNKKNAQDKVNFIQNKALSSTSNFKI